MIPKFLYSTNYLSALILIYSIAQIGCGSASFRNAYNLQEDGKLDEAIQYWEKALLECRLRGEFLNAAIVLSNMSRNYYVRKEYQRSIDYAEQSLKELEKVKGKNQEAKAGIQSTCYSRLGNNYFWLGKYSMARDFFKKADQIEISMGKTGCSGNLGAVYHILGDLDQAIINYQKALVIDDELGGADWLQNLAVVYKQKENFSKAMFYQEKFENYCSENKNNDRCKSAMDIEWGRADILLQMGRDREAYQIFKKYEIKSGIGEYYLKNGIPQKAKDLFEAALRGWEVGEQNRSQLWIFLGKTCETLGEYQNAEHFYQKAVDYFESQLANLDAEDRKMFISGPPGAGSVTRAMAYQGLEQVSKKK